MDDQDTFVYLKGTGVRRSEFTADSFDFAARAGASAARSRRDSCRRAMQPLIDLAESPAAGTRSSSTTTGTRCSATCWSAASASRRCGCSARCSTSRAASTSRSSSGSPTGTTTSSATSSTSTPAPTRSPDAFAPLAHGRHAPRRRGARRSTSTPTASTVRFRDAVGDRGRGQRRRVHPHRPARAPSAHGDHAASTSTSGSRSGTSTTAGRTRSSCSSAGAGGSRTTRSPTA